MHAHVRQFGEINQCGIDDLLTLERDTLAL